jgi:hypothetical protein
MDLRGKMDIRIFLSKISNLTIGLKCSIIRIISTSISKMKKVNNNSMITSMLKSSLKIKKISKNTILSRMPFSKPSEFSIKTKNSHKNLKIMQTWPKKPYKNST